MPSSRAASAPAAKSVGAVAGALHVDALSVAMCLNVRSSSALASSAAVARGARLPIVGFGGREHALERAVAAQQLGGGLRADAGRAGQAVGGVAAQRDEVGDLLGSIPP